MFRGQHAFSILSCSAKSEYASSAAFSIDFTLEPFLPLCFYISVTILTASSTSTKSMLGLAIFAPFFMTIPAPI